MATTREVMQWVAKLDTKDAEQGFDRLADAGKESFDEVGDEAEKSSSRFSGVGGKMGKAMVAGFAAVGVGAILLQQIDAAFGRMDAFNKLKGQFNLTAEEAERTGKIAGDLYSEGWGDGLSDVQEAVALTSRRLKTENEEVTTEMARAALAVSETWGTEVGEVLRSTSQLLENDLVDSAEAGMDLIVAAFQNGGDEAGDLLDTIDEYSQHWADMGLSGEDALNMIVDGFQNGQRDADKMADAVKEMGIRIREGTDPVREALENIGLDAQDTIDAFLEGGPRAREAFLKVVDGLEQGIAAGGDTQDAVALIGTQFEDMGVRALGSLQQVDGALQDTTGAAENLATTVEKTEWEKLQRQGESALAGIGDHIAEQVLPGLEQGADLLDGLQTGFGLWGDSGTEAAEDVADAVDDANGVLGENRRLMHDKARADVEASRAADDLAAAQRNANGRIGEGRRALHDKARADAQAADAAEDHAAAVAELEEELADLLGLISDEAALLNLKDEFDAVEDAALRAAQAQKEFGADSEEANRAARDHRQSLLDLKTSVAEYATQVLGLPANQVTDIVAKLDGSNTAEIERRLEALARDREMVIRARTTLSTFTPTSFNVNGRTYTAYADGTNHHPGGMALVGEEGPELVDLPRGSKVSTAAETRRLAGSAAGIGGGTVINLTVNAGMGADGGLIGKRIVDEIKRFERFNGSTWRT